MVAPFSVCPLETQHAFALRIGQVFSTENLLRFVAMFAELRVAVVIPAFNEELNVARTVRDVPAWVDHVLVVDDASHDRTFLEASRQRRRGLEVLQHPRNRGVGAAIATGYRRALALGVDAAVVMAGDGQMDPADLPALLAPVVAGGADYVKGNRFAHGEVWRVMPAARIAGNVALSLATKLTSGYWQLFDSQCGYTVASRRALSVIDAAGLFPRYGYPNDLLARLHAAGLRVRDVPVRAIYGANWRSGIGLSTVVYPMSFVLVRSWLRRLFAGRSAPIDVAAPTQAEPRCASAS
jgi:glycosyltransferase involved in cell wall biosynthesis